MTDPYITVATGKDVLGTPWQVGVRGPGVTVHIGGSSDTLCLDGQPLAEFAAAVTRAHSHAQQRVIALSDLPF